MIAPEFLDLEEVLEIHALQLDEFGGIAGVRDRGLLESAVEQPRATAFGELCMPISSKWPRPTSFIS
jgi:death-on-curing protein